MGRSEGIVLQRTVEFMRTQLQERRELIAKIESNGGHIDDELKKYVLPSQNCWEGCCKLTLTQRVIV